MHIETITSFFLFGVLYTNVETCPVEYKCFRGQPKVVQIDKTNLTCAEATICNSYDDSCLPCIPEDTKCMSKFICKNKFEVHIAESILQCPTNYICNVRNEGDCPPCIRERCTETQIYKCDKYNKQRVTIYNIDKYCNPGFECNADFIKPCDPCIPSNYNIAKLVEAATEA